MTRAYDVELPLLRLMKSALTEIDDRPLQDVANAIHAKARTAIAIKEYQPVLALVRIDTALAHARDRAFSHQRLDIGGRDSQQLAEKRGIDDNVGVGDLNLHRDA